MRHSLRLAQMERLYNKRVSVERAFSRLKGYRKLNDVRTRGLNKVWLHVALSLLAMLGSKTPNSLAPTRPRGWEVAA